MERVGLSGAAGGEHHRGQAGAEGIASRAGGESAADAARADGGDGRNPQSEETAYRRMVRRSDSVPDLRGHGGAIPAGLVEFCLA